MIKLQQSNKFQKQYFVIYLIIDRETIFNTYINDKNLIIQ